MSARQNLSPLQKGDRVRGSAGRRGTVVLADAPWLKHDEVVVQWTSGSKQVEQMFDHELFRTHKVSSRRKRRRSR